MMTGENMTCGAHPCGVFLGAAEVEGGQQHGLQV